MIALYQLGSEKHSNRKYDGKTWRNRTQSRCNTTLHTPQMVSYSHCYVDCQNTGKRLRNSQQIEELLPFNPSFVIDHFTLYQRNHGPSASKCEGAYPQKGAEELEIYTL